MFKSSDLLGIEKVTIGFPKFLVVTINIFLGSNNQTSFMALI